MKSPTLISAILLAVTLTVNATERPNILFFLVDDMGTQDTSVPFHFDQDGKPVVTETNKLFRTPNMETLARNGRRFTKAYAYSVCSPTRVSLMTGQAAPRHRVTTWTHPASSTEDPGQVRTKTITGPEWNTKGVPTDIPLLTTELQKAGYTTLFAGKAHFGPDDTHNGDPLNLGFDVSIAGFGGGGPGSYYGNKNYSASWRGGGHIWDIPDLETYHGTETFLTEALTIEMNAAISKAVEGDKPFFAYMSHYAVHAPFEADARFAQNYPTLKGEKLAFATLVEGMDKSLGDMMAHLETLGIAEDTLIIFYSDNGSAGPFNNAPLKGMKGHRHEGGIRVPLIAAWAKLNPENRFQKRFYIPANSVDDGLVSCLDMMPTFLNIAGGRVPAGTIQDGQTILPQIAGKPGAHRPSTFLAHFPHGQHNNTLFTSYINGDWKVIYNYADKTWELYNLTDDISEANNLAKAQPERARSLAQQMLAELHAQRAQFPISLNDGKPTLPELNFRQAEITATKTDWKLIWQDEFEGSKLDQSKWSRVKKGNADWKNTMSDSPDLLTIRDGVMTLHGIQNPNSDGPPYLTAGVDSRNKFDFTYGKVQIRARYKSAQGAWPALWMLGIEKGWPANGEIDLMEHLNFDDKIYQTVHSEYTLKVDQTNTPKKGGTAKIKRDKWNTYGCEWDAESLVFTVNGKPTHTYPRVAKKGAKQWPFNQPFYFVLSMQIGGSWVNGSGATNPKHYPADMEVDWVRVYQK